MNVLKMRYKKLIYVANARIPNESAHTNQIVQMCEAFGKKIDTLLVTLPGTVNEDLFDYYGVKKTFEVKFLNLPEFLLKNYYLRDAPLILYSSFLVWVHKIKGLKVLLFSRSILSSFFVKVFTNAFTIYEIHDIRWDNSSMFFSIKKSILMRLNKIVAITQGLKEKLTSGGIKENKILVLPDGANLKKFDINANKEELKKHLGIPMDKTIIMYMGQLYEWKGVDILVKSIPLINDKNSTQFVIIGGVKRDIKRVKNLADNLNILDKIIFIDFVEPKRVPLYLKLADVLVLPNSGKYKISKKYTSPLKLFEYMASRKPIVASDLPSIREILNEECAELIDPDNPKELTNAIEKILNDKKLSTKLSRNAYKKVEEYTWDKRVENIFKFISIFIICFSACVCG